MARSDCSQSEIEYSISDDETTVTESNNVALHFYVGLPAEALSDDRKLAESRDTVRESIRSSSLASDEINKDDLNGSTVNTADGKLGADTANSVTTPVLSVLFQSLLDQYDSLNRQSISTIHRPSSNIEHFPHLSVSTTHRSSRVSHQPSSDGCFESSPSSPTTFDGNFADNRKHSSTLLTRGGVYWVDLQPSMTHGSGEFLTVSCTIVENDGSSSTNNTVDGNDETRSSSSNLPRSSSSLVLERRVAVDQGRSLKRGPQAEILRLHRNYNREIIMKVLRNVGCWTLIGALLTIAGEGKHFSYHFSADANHVIVSLILLLGVMGLVSQIFHFCREESSKAVRRSVLANMLRKTSTKAQFEQLILDRQQEAPYIGLELRERHHLWRPLSAADHHDVTHSRRTVRLVEYESWTDDSRPLYDIKWPPGHAGPWCIVVAKDFRLLGSERLLESEEMEFKTYGHFNDTKMKFEYITDVKQGNDEFPDCEMFLLMSGTESCARKMWCSLTFYRIVLCLCLDSLYAGLLYSSTPQLEDYIIVKYFTMKTDFST